MLNKVFEIKKSKGPHGGIDYLLGNEGRSSDPELLRGNEAITRQLLVETTGEQAYTTGVCSFEELASDVPFEVQEEIMDLYEETIMAGFPRDHYDMMWIRHTDKNGRLELNWHIVNQDLVTGRVITPYYDKQDQYRLNLAKQIINDKYNFASPDDPAREREITAENNFGDRKDVQEKINSAILDELNNDRINNRDGVINFLNNMDGIEISRITPSSISIKITNNDDIKKPIRLKGAIFSNKFNQAIGSYLSAKAEFAEEYNRQRDKRLAANIEKLQESNKRIAASRERLLEAPKTNPRNTKQFEQIEQDDINSCIEVEGIRNDGNGDVREVSEQIEIHDRLELVDTTLRNSSDVTGVLDRESLLREKEKRINEIINNHEYNISNFREAESSRNEFDQANRGSESIFELAAERFSAFLNKLIQRVSNGRGIMQQANKQLAAASSGFTAAIAGRTAAESETRKAIEECDRRCYELAQLLAGTSPRTLTLTLSSNVKNETKVVQKQVQVTRPRSKMRI